MRACPTRFIDDAVQFRQLLLPACGGLIDNEVCRAQDPVVGRSAALGARLFGLPREPIYYHLMLLHSRSAPSVTKQRDDGMVCSVHATASWSP